MIYIRDIIRKKRRGEALTEDEVVFFIIGYFRKEISEEQAAALMSEIHRNGLNDNEMAYMTKAIASTGDEFEFYRISNKIVDIHPIGGISDKIVLLLMSILNGLGLPAGKVIGRELGMEDRLISVKGYKLEENVEKFTDIMQKEKFSILKSIKELAPVEYDLYRLRHEIACDNDMKLIAISIMSQKIALGFHNIFFEITYGENAYAKTLQDAKRLAKYMVSIGQVLMRNVGYCITKMNEPIGNYFGNLLEMKEIYEILSGRETDDVREVVLGFGCHILETAAICNSKSKSERMIKEVISNGKALESFKYLLTSQGGDISILEKDINVKYRIPVMANRDGYIVEIDVNKIRMLAKYLDAIRTNEKDKMDIGAGIILNKKVGDKISRGEIMGYIYTNNQVKIDIAVDAFKKLVKISDRKPKTRGRITI